MGLEEALTPEMILLQQPEERSTSTSKFRYFWGRNLLVSLDYNCCEQRYSAPDILHCMQA